MFGEQTDPDSSSAIHMLKSLSQISDVLGEPVGEPVGACPVLSTGDPDGERDGLKVGCLVLSSDDDDLGCLVGYLVGQLVGCLVGLTGFPVGE